MLNTTYGVKAHILIRATSFLAFFESAIPRASNFGLSEV